MRETVDFGLLLSGVDVGELRGCSTNGMGELRLSEQPFFLPRQLESKVFLKVGVPVGLVALAGNKSLNLAFIRPVCKQARKVQAYSIRHRSDKYVRHFLRRSKIQRATTLVADFGSFYLRLVQLHAVEFGGSLRATADLIDRWHPDKDVTRGRLAQHGV